MKKLASILLAVVFLSTLALAQSQTPSHPLSHIHPVDTDFNMSSNGIFNVSWINLTDDGEITFKDGLRFTNTSIQDNGRNNIWEWNSNLNEWELKNGNLDMNGNRIKNVPAPQSGGDAVNKTYTDEMAGIVNQSATQNLQEVLSEGNVAGGYNIDMNDENITNIGELQNYFQTSVCGAGEVIEGINPDGTYQCTSIDAEAKIENLSETLVAGNIANQSINMDGNNLVLNNGYISNDGDNEGLQVTNSGNVLVPNGGVDVGSPGVSAGAGEIHVENNIAFNNNAVQIARGTQGASSGSLTLDTYNDVLIYSENGVGNLAWFREGGNMELPNGDFRISRDYASIYLGPSDDIRLMRNSVDNTFRLRNSTDSDILIGEQSGNVRIPNGDLSLPNSITNYYENNICGDNKAVQKIYENGTVVCTPEIQFSTNTETLAETLEAGNTANQTISMDGNSVEEIGSGRTNVTDTGKIEAGADIDVNNQNLNDVNSIDGNGDAVRVDNDLDMNGNSVTSSGGEICIGDECT